MPLVTNDNESGLGERGSNLGPGGAGGTNYPTGQTNPPSSIPSSIPPDVVTFVNGTRVTNPDRNVPPETPNNIPPAPPRTAEELAELANQRRATRTPPARPIDVFGEIRRGTIEPQRSIGVNYFLDIDQFGFSLNKNRLTTDFKLNEFGGPERQQGNILDLKGDFSPIYSFTNKAGSVFSNTSFIQNKPAPSELFLDRKGDFSPVFTENRKAPATYFATSRLLELSKTNIFNGKTIDEYYERIDNANDRLSIKRGRGGVDTEFPRVIRKVGQRWGEGTFQVPFQIPAEVQNAINVTNELAESILGREPAVYLNKFSSEVSRLLPFANPLSIYSLKQATLQRRNPFKYPSSVLYAFNGNESLKEVKVQQEANSLYNQATSLVDPRGYNPLSIFSAPGVVMINRMSSILDPVTIFRKAPVGALALAGIAGTFSAGVLQAAAPVAGKTVIDVVSLGIKGAGSLGNSLAGAIGGINIGKGAGGNLNLGQGIGNILGGIGSAASAIGGAVGSVVSNIPVPDFTKFSLGGIGKSLELKDPFNDDQKKFFKTVGGAVAGTLETGVELAQAAAEYTRDKAAKFTEQVGVFGKKALQEVDLEAFNNLGVDYVNLIKYAQDNWEGKKYYDLDFVPFKFHDIRHDAPIVFRAILSGITDTFSPDYATERYVGRPDNVYVYQGTTREISFTFDVYPKSDRELISIWQKLNYLAGLTYPHVSAPGPDGGRGMISPYTRLTIGEMYNEAPGVITALTITVMDETTWETSFAKLPKYCQVSVTFAYIGNKVMSAEQKLYDLPSVPEVDYETRLKSPIGEALNLLKTGDTGAGRITAFKDAFNDESVSQEKTIGVGVKSVKKLLGDVGLG